MVEASLALAGFAGVVNALATRGGEDPNPIHRLSLENLLATSFTALFLSLAALASLSSGIEEATTWSIISIVAVIPTIYFSMRSARTVTAAVRDRGSNGLNPLWLINGTLFAVCGLQIVNALLWGAFWPIFVLLIALFAVGCFSFVRLLIEGTR